MRTERRVLHDESGEGMRSSNFSLSWLAPAVVEEGVKILRETVDGAGNITFFSRSNRL